METQNSEKKIFHISDEFFVKFFDAVNYRYILIFFAALANTIEYSLRDNLSITIVAMLNSTSPLNKTKHSEMTTSLIVDWSPKLQGIILGAFYYGYIITHFYGGQLVLWFGPKKLITFSLFVSSLLTIILPLLISFNAMVIIMLRFAIGLCQGVLTPSIYFLFSHWIPNSERAIALAILNVGGNFGSLMTMILSGYLCEHGFAGGWPSVFYVLGIAGFNCFFFWIYFIYDTPDKHPSMSLNEKIFIKTNIDHELETKKIPWLTICTSSVVWSIAIAKFAGKWGIYIIETKLPAYLADVHKLPIEMNGTVNAMVYISMCLGLCVAGYLSDVITSRNLIKKEISRKLFESVALICPAILLAIIPSMKNDTTLIIIILIVAMFLYSFYAGGDNIIVIDIGPQYSGAIYGFTCGLASIPGFVAPYFVGSIIELDKFNPKMWDLVFYLSSIIYIAGALVFLIFSSTKPLSFLKKPINCYKV